jgi:hypothetical protein
VFPQKEEKPEIREAQVIRELFEDVKTKDRDSWFYKF